MHTRLFVIVVTSGLSAALALAVAYHRRTSPRATAPLSDSTTAAPALSSRQNDGSSQLNEARLVLERQCGICHRQDSPEAKRGALAVFNLNTTDWAASMSDDRLRDANWRLRDMQPSGRSDDSVLAGDFGGTTTTAEVAAFDAFVSGELARRGRQRVAETPSAIRASP
jgi:hypothetical protein